VKGSPTQIGQQLLAIWRQLGLNQRVSIVVTALALLGALVGLAVWSSGTEYALLYGKLDDAEAARVISALDDAKVPYKINRAGGAITVPADKVHLMRMQLAAKGIPRAGDGVGFEIFDKPAFGISDFVQRANYLRAVQGELARTISQVDSIESARVMIVMPENRLLVDGSKRPTASVLVRTRGNYTLPQQTVNAIRFLVANAVEGLQANYVTVVDNQGNVLSENSEENSLAGLTTSQLSARKELEHYLAKKAEGMLEKVLGPGQAVVRVAAEINFDTVTRTEEKFDPDGQVIRTTTLNDENTDTTTSTPNAGVPGVSANANSETNSPASNITANRTNTKKKVTNTQFEINKSTSSIGQTAGGLKRISAAVFIAARMTTTGTNRVVTPRTPEELQKLRRTVQSALGIQEGGDAQRLDEITLEEMPFNDQQAVEITKQLETEEKKQMWIGLATKIAYPLLGLVILGLFWRTFNKTPLEEIPLGIPVGEFALNGNGAPEPNGNGHHSPANGKPQPAGVVTAEVLNQLIRENPNNMAEAIRTWLNRGKAK
jgi:flagellar M-ring protein FliF